MERTWKQLENVVHAVRHYVHRHRRHLKISSEQDPRTHRYRNPEPFTMFIRCTPKGVIDAHTMAIRAIVHTDARYGVYEDCVSARTTEIVVRLFRYLLPSMHWDLVQAIEEVAFFFVQQHAVALELTIGRHAHFHFEIDDCCKKDDESWPMTFSRVEQLLLDNPETIGDVIVFRATPDAAMDMEHDDLNALLVGLRTDTGFSRIEADIVPLTGAVSITLWRRPYRWPQAPARISDAALVGHEYRAMGRRPTMALIVQSLHKTQKFSRYFKWVYRRFRKDHRDRFDTDSDEFETDSDDTSEEEPSEPELM